MRAIWFILKLPLKILMAPVILSLTLFVWICIFNGVRNSC